VERKFQERRQITTKTGITGAQFILKSVIFDLLKLSAVF
jgi:hypothetical protein